MNRLFFIGLFCVFVNLASAGDGSLLWVQSLDPAEQPVRCCKVAAKGSLPTQDSLLMQRVASELTAWKGAPIGLQLVADSTLSAEAYRLTRTDDSIRLGASTVRGLLQGAYCLLRAQAMDDVCLCRTLTNHEPLKEAPAYAWRLISAPPALDNEEWTGFVRACASVGLNGIVTSTPDSDQVQVCIDYGLRLYEPQMLNQLTLIRLTPESGNASGMLYKVQAWSTLLADADGVWLDELPRDYDSPLAAANWYAFGRLAWNRHLSPRALAYEWVAQTYCSNPLFCVPVVQALLMPYETVREQAENLMDVFLEQSSYLDTRQYDLTETELLQYF